MNNAQNIAVLGAGIMGLLCAYKLACAGHGISLYSAGEKSASALAGGMLAPYSEIEHMNGPWVEAGRSGIDFWEKFTGKTGFLRKGSLLMAHPQDSHLLARFQGFLAREGADFETVLPAALEPDLTEDFRAGLFLPHEAHLNPALVLESLRAALEKDGVKTISEAARPEDLAARFDYVIDARGMGAAESLPDLRAVKGELMIVRNPDFSLTRPVRLMHPRYPLYIVPRGNGVFMIGATQIESEGDHASLRSLMELSSALYALHPGFGEAQVLEITSGLRPAFPDNLPRVSVHENIIRSNGLFRHGFLLAPVMADIVERHIAGQTGRFHGLFTNHPQRREEKLHSAA